MLKMIRRLGVGSRPPGEGVDFDAEAGSLAVTDKLVRATGQALSMTRRERRGG
jgi:hypothetical protein